MSTLRISDAPLLPNVDGAEKIPTGGRGDYAVSVDQIKDYVRGGLPQQIEDHINDTENPHQVSKSQIGLGNVDNTADADKPVSNSTQAAIISAVSPKADKTYVDSQDQLKADKITVEASLLLKADKVDLTASRILSGGNQTQQSVNDFGGARWYAKSGGYELGATVKLENGDIVKSTKSNNIFNPNVDLTGWVLADSALNSIKLQRENVSVWDFFTPAELSNYKAAPATFDAYRPIQEFFNYIRDNDVGTAYCSGNFRVSEGIIFGGSAGSKTKMVSGYFYITALNAIDTMMTVQAGQSFVWQGSITAYGTGSTSYASRTCRVGIKWGGVYTSSRNAITNIVVSRFSQVGLSCNNLTTLTNFGDVKASDCGSGWVSGSLSANFSNRIDSGSPGSTSAKSKITVDVLPPEVLETHLHVIIGGELFFVDSVDRENKTLNINTWFDLTLQTGSLRYLFGAGVLSSGGDSSVNKFAKIDATRCSYGYLCQSLYPPFVDNLVGQYCGVVFGIGQSPASASLGGAIGNLYCEASEFEVARLTRADLSFSILSTGPSDLSRSTRANNGRLGNNASGVATAAFKSLSMGYYGSVLSSEGAIYATTNGSIDIVNQDRSPVRYFTNNLNVNIVNPRLDLIRLFAYDFRKLVVFGTSSANNFTPTTVTFNAPSGYTVNGQASVTFTNFSCVAEFDVALYRGTTDFLVALVGNVIKQATVTYDPPSLAAGTRDVIQTMTVTGANLGDNVNMSFNKDLQGVSLIGYVSAANTVSYYFENRSSATVDLVSGTVKAKIV